MTQTEWLQSAIGYINSDNKNMAIKCINESLRTPPPAAMKFPEPMTYKNNWIYTSSEIAKIEAHNACLKLCKELNAPNVEQSGYSTETPKFTGNPGRNETCEHDYVFVGGNSPNLYECCKKCSHLKIIEQPSEKKESDINELSELLERRTLEVIKRNPHLKGLESLYYEELAIEYSQALINAGWSKKEGKDG